MGAFYAGSRSQTTESEHPSCSPRQKPGAGTRTRSHAPCSQSFSTAVPRQLGVPKDTRQILAGRTLDNWDPTIPPIHTPTQQALHVLEWVHRREDLADAGLTSIGVTFPPKTFGRTVAEQGKRNCEIQRPGTIENHSRWHTDSNRWIEPASNSWLPSFVRQRNRGSEPARESAVGRKRATNSTQDATQRSGGSPSHALVAGRLAVRSATTHQCTWLCAPGRRWRCRSGALPDRGGPWSRTRGRRLLAICIRDATGSACSVAG